MIPSLPNLETKRLLLRPVTCSDVQLLYNLWTHPEVRRYLWDDELISWARAADTVDKSIAAAETESLGMWLVLERSQSASEMIGFVCLRHPEGSEEVELLYGLHPSVWGTGYATEASKVLLDYGFNVLGLLRIVAGADLSNTKSFRVGHGASRDAGTPGGHSKCSRCEVLFRGKDRTGQRLTGKFGGQPKMPCSFRGKAR